MKKLLSLLFLAAVVATLCVTAFATETFTNPVAPGADPFVLKDDDGTYYLYVTSGDAYGYRVFSSKNLVEWTAHGYCMTVDDAYIDPESSVQDDNYLFWAPEVIKYNDKYYMICTYQKRLSIAVSDSPLGPFKSVSEQFLFNDYYAIDGNFFLDDDGTMYFYFVTGGAANFNGVGVKKGSNIWGGKFDMDTLRIDFNSVKLLVTNNEEYEKSGLVVEGPFMLKNDGKYYLTFSSADYRASDYAVCVATGDSPLGTFFRDGKGLVLESDDIEYKDIDNPHLYGTAHHSFIEAPNGKDLLIIYHCHRTNKTWNPNVTVDNYCSPRSVCIDYAWFEDGKLYAGSKENPGVPTATAQPLLEGTKLERQQYLTGTFEKLNDLPTVYVAYTDGNDDNDGSKDAPVKSLSKAFNILTKGGTVVLTQNYNTTNLTVPTARGPIMITAEHNNVILTYHYISIKNNLYIDNIIFAPESDADISVIECGFNNVVFGEGVSTLNRPFGDHSFPYIVGGKWNYSGTANISGASNYKYEASALTSTKNYNIAVLGGKWEMIEAGSVDYKTPVAGSAPGGVVVTEGAKLGEPTPTTPVTPVTPVTPAPAKTEIKMTIGSATAYVNGEAKTLDAAPINRSSRTMLPVRFLAENLGATVEWDDATKTATLKDATTTIAITIGASSMTVNGADVALDSPALIENSRTYLPLRAIANALGVSNDNITWDDATKTATLVK